MERETFLACSLAVFKSWDFLEMQMAEEKGQE